MGAKAVDIFQGSDWLTYRWAAAQAFDTLDRIRDLCLQMPAASGARPGTSNPGRPRYEMPEEEIADVFSYIAELCDDLAGELDAVHADLFPFLQNNMLHRWLAFEMRLYLKDLQQCALGEAKGEVKNEALLSRPTDAIIILAARIKDLLKQIDQ